MKATGVDLIQICQLEKSDSVCVDLILASTDIEDLIEHAKSGDKYAARELLGLASSYLASDVFGAMPLELRRYLSRALASIGLGEKADKALNLGKSGRPRQSHRTKLRLAHWMQKIKDSGKSYEDASFDVCDSLKEGTQEQELFFGYTKKHVPGEKGIQAIYDKYLPEIEALYEEVRKTRASLKT